MTSAYLAATGQRFGVLVGVTPSPPRSQKGRQDGEALNLLYPRQRPAAQVRYPAAMLAYMTAGLGVHARRRPPPRPGARAPR